MKHGSFIFTSDPPAIPGQWHLMEGDAVERLRGLPDNSVQCTITSQPYLGQRTYGVEGEYGRERFLHEHVENMTRVAEELLRVTTQTGVLFWNLRDSYNGSGGPGGDHRNLDGSYRINRQKGFDSPELPRKSLCCIPALLQLRFSNLGWIPRSRIIWSKRDAFCAAPDRLSYSYEEILFFSKSEQYKFDPEAVKERSATSGTDARLLDVWTFPAGRQPSVTVAGETLTGTASFPSILPEICLALATEPGDVVLDPFCGFGTTLLAAVSWGRHAIGIDINRRDLAATTKRLYQAGYGSQARTEPPRCTNYRGLPLVERMI